MELQEFIKKVIESNKDSGMTLETLDISIIATDDKVLVCQNGVSGCAQVRIVPFKENE